MRNYLDFEKDIKTLEEDLESSKNPFDKDGISEVNTDKIKKIEKEINEKLDSTYSNLNSWQKTMVARHEDRPRANFYINKIFSNFTLLSGDRLYGEDKSILSGFGLIDGKSVLVLGQEKGERAILQDGYGQLAKILGISFEDPDVSSRNLEAVTPEMASIDSVPSDFAQASEVPPEGNASNASTLTSDVSAIVETVIEPSETSEFDTAPTTLEAKDSVPLSSDGD